jgi:ankyrin repeat protein
MSAKQNNKKSLHVALFEAAQRGAEQLSCVAAEQRRTVLRDAAEQLRNALIQACEQLDAAAVDVLVAAGADVSCRATDARAPLSAVFEGRRHVDFGTASLIVTRLLDLGAPIDAEPTNSCTALGMAVHGDHMELAQLLIDRGSNVLQRDKHGRSLLHVAMCGRGGSAMIDYLVARGLDVLARDNDGNTLLHAAVSSAEGRAAPDRVQLLARAGIDVNASNKRGETALYTAAAAGLEYVSRPRNAQHDAAVALLELGADANARTVDGVTALHETVESERDASEFLEALVSHGADVNARTNLGFTPLMCLVARMEYDKTRGDLLRLLVKRGADINAVNNAGESAFGIAVEDNDMAYWEKLVELGVDINQQIVGRGTALHVLVGCKRRAQVQRLLELGADARRGDEFGSSPIWFAATDNKCFLIRDLVDHGGDCNAPNSLGETPLDVAIRNEQLGAIRMLAKYGANVNAVNARSGETALTYATRLGFSKVVAQLVDLGADIGATNRAGDTPLMLVSHGDTARVLLKVGADARAVNRHGETALGVAWRRRKADVATALIVHGVTERGNGGNCLGEVALAVDDVDELDFLSVLLRTPYLCDWFLECLELPDLAALLLVNHTAYRAVSAHWRDRTRHRFLLADATLRLLCPSHDCERAMLRRMMEASRGRWVVVVHGEVDRIYDCVQRALDDVLCQHEHVQVPGEYEGGCLCPCARKGKHSATEPLFVRCAVGDSKPFVACSSTKAGDGWRLAACGKCGAQRPFLTSPEWSICSACVETRPLMWLQWCAHVGVGYDGGNRYDHMRILDAADDVVLRAMEYEVKYLDSPDALLAHCCAEADESSEARLDRAIDRAMTRAVDADTLQTTRDILAAPRQSLGMIKLPYHAADGFIGFTFVALLGDEATAIRAGHSEGKKRKRASSGDDDDDD